MYKRADFTQLEGLGFTQDNLDFLQTSYRDAIGAMAGLFGDLVIVTGLADLGANWGDGWVAINGELMPFVGGLKASNILVEETIATESFADGSNKNVYYTKRAKLANSGGNAFNTFTRLSTLKVMKTDLAAALVSAATAIANAATAQNAANNAQTSANNANTNANNRVAKGGDVMTGALQLNAGMRFQNAGPEFFKKTIDINDWNMDVDMSKSIDLTPYGIDISKITNVSVIIFGDPNIVDGSITKVSLFHASSAGGYPAGSYVTSTTYPNKIDLYRTNGGMFDAFGYTQAPFNRGKLTIEYTS